MADNTDATAGADTVDIKAAEAAKDKGASKDVDKTAKTAEGDKDANDNKAEGWWDTIPDEKVKTHARRYASPADVATAEFKARQQLSNAIIPLGKDPKPEDVAVYRKKTGVPLTPEGYKFETVDGQEPTDFDKAFQSTLSKALHDNHVPAPVARALSRVYNDFVTEIQRQVSESDTAEIEAAQTVLGRKWGSDFKANASAGDKFLQEAAEGTGSPITDLKNLIVAVGGKKILLGSVPLFLEAVAFAGRRLMEGSPLVPSADELRDVDAELRKLYDLHKTGKLREYNLPANQQRIQTLEGMKLRAKKQKAA